MSSPSLPGIGIQHPLEKVHKEAELFQLFRRRLRMTGRAVVHDDVLELLLSKIAVGLLLLELGQATLALALFFGQEVDVLLSGLECPGGRRRAVGALLRCR